MECEDLFKKTHKNYNGITKTYVEKTCLLRQFGICKSKKRKMIIKLYP